jgi:cytochrome c
MKYTNLIIAAIFTSAFLIAGCGGDGSKTNQNQAQQQETEDGLTPFEQEHGIGPIDEEIVINEIDMEMARRGAEIFEMKCSSCHKLNERYIGPPMGDILEKRSPTYVMNMILNPNGMVEEHPEAKEVLIEYNMSPMPNQGLTEEEARAIVEYFASDLE